MRNPAVLLVAIAMVGCPNERRREPEVVPPSAEETPPVSNDGTLASFAGSYTLGSASAPSECGGKLILAAKHIRVIPESTSLEADVVDRVYVARVVDGRLVAEGKFTVSGTCPSTLVYEKWTLGRDAGGGLIGELESHWSLPPECQRPCTVKFPIVASPVPE
jgi:hypothetical protein